MSVTLTDTPRLQRQHLHTKAGMAEGPTAADLGRHIRLLRGLSEGELSEIISSCDVRRIEPRSQIVIDGAMVRRVFFIVHGAGRLLAFAPDGSSVTMANFKAGDALGVAYAMIGEAYDHHAGRLVCDETATILTMSQEKFRDLAEASPALCRASCQLVSQLHVGLNRRYYELTTLDVRGRLLAELVRLADCGEYDRDQVVLNSAPTHAELGDQIGAAREAVTRQLLELQREGIIESSRRRIVIKCPALLLRLHEMSAGRPFR